AKEKSD
nr:Chain C, Wbp1 [Homo sapiens]4J77_D Chain D, Wbp1 [Homo sapiens]8HQX_B Chain B, TAT-WDM KxKxx motif [Homo sapiens]